MEFEFEEKETYTLEDVQSLVKSFKGVAGEIITAKDETIAGLTTDTEKVKELEESNHNLQVKNLAVTNGISEDLMDLILDDDMEIVKTKIELVKNLKKVDTEKLYKPENKRTEDTYEKAIKNKDVEGALKNKFGRLFG